MERVSKVLQSAALIVALLAPWIYFMGYAYEWGYFDSFLIERQIFFKAPPEYFGLAYLVFIGLYTKILSAIPVNDLTPIALPVIGIISVSLTTILYWGYRTKRWQCMYTRYSNWEERLGGKVTRRFIHKVIIPSYLFTMSLPILWVGLILLSLPFFTLPYLGYKKGSEDANHIKQEWHSDTCESRNKMLGCTQLLEEGKKPIVGKLIAASDKYAAIFDGDSVTIYPLNNKAIKTTLTK